jgi:hypothetical protein
VLLLLGDSVDGFFGLKGAANSNISYLSKTLKGQQCWLLGCFILIDPFFFFIYSLLDSFL